MLKIKYLVIVVLLFFLISCDKENKSTTISKRSHSLTLIDKVEINIPEPSGLTYSPFTKTLFTVSDETSKIYEISIYGRVMSEQPTRGSDTEGITVVSDTSFAVVYERSREIELFDLRNRSLLKVKLEINGNLNNGLEGITYDSLNKKYFVLNEKNPCSLIELDDSLNEINRTTLNFADDLSGIYCDANKNELWIISDESQSIIRCDYKLNILERFQVDIPQIEGIAIDAENKKLFLISDRTGILYTYQMN